MPGRLGLSCHGYTTDVVRVAAVVPGGVVVVAVAVVVSMCRGMAVVAPGACGAGASVGMRRVKEGRFVAVRRVVRAASGIVGGHSVQRGVRA